MSGRFVARNSKYLTGWNVRTIEPRFIGSLFQPDLVDTPGIRDHIAKASALKLPHASWLTERLDAGDCLTPEQAASAIAFALTDMPVDDFSGAVLHGRTLVDTLSFNGS
ncbi:hypothetical protein [Marinobacter zhanjiangensis]|uniref:Uncharacterized protein n=1 Tax=Marinobacter zhanjiangensis TaxID=578215 RepID=A0ABQ3BBR1_9GAMM|nr:hypothetical protein [Marinobacter zhanjiangensis]GGY83008.1 hypothetical protein GCM10007071_33120 [Marinobacter zhanjiangensis]